MVLSTPKPQPGDSNADRSVPHLTMDSDNSIVMEYLSPSRSKTLCMVCILRGAVNVRVGMSRDKWLKVHLYSQIQGAAYVLQHLGFRP
jgi:hypothetical protein